MTPLSPTWPDTAPGRHVPDINNEQATMKASNAFESNGFSGTLLGRRRVYVDKGFAVVVAHVGFIGTPLPRVLGFGYRRGIGCSACRLCLPSMILVLPP